MAGDIPTRCQAVRACIGRRDIVATSGGARGASLFRSTGGGAATSVATGSALVLADVQNIGVLGLLARVAARNVIQFVELHGWATFNVGRKIAGATTASRATSRTTLWRNERWKGTKRRRKRWELDE